MGNNPNVISIALGTPKWIKNSYTDLAPPYGLLHSWQKHNITEEEYTKRYYEEVLNKLDPIKVYEDLGDEAVLCCWEASDKFCHRHLVAKWLKDELNITVKELE